MQLTTIPKKVTQQLSFSRFTFVVELVDSSRSFSVTQSRII